MSTNEQTPIALKEEIVFTTCEDLDNDNALKVIQQHDTILNGQIKADLTLQPSPILNHSPETSNSELPEIDTAPTTTICDSIVSESTIETKENSNDALMDTVQVPPVSAEKPITSGSMETDVEDFVTSIIGGNAPTENKNAEENATKDVLDTAIAAADVTTTGYESSDLEMSSDEDSDSSDESDEEVSGEAKTELYDDEDEEPAGTTELRTTNEIVEVVIEKPNYILTPQTEIIAIGTIHNVINNVIVVQTTPGSVFALDIGTLFVYGDRELMGEVFETFGPVQRPFYSVRYNKAEEIDKERAVVGARVFFVPSYERTNVIQVEALKKIKGTDASNIYDEEAGEDELEFSDDEKEMEHKKSLKAKRKSRASERNGKDRAPKRPAHQSLPATGTDDFSAEMADYQGYSNYINQAVAPPPGRQVQSYADISNPNSSNTHY